MSLPKTLQDVVTKTWLPSPNEFALDISGRVHCALPDETLYIGNVRPANYAKCPRARTSLPQLQSIQEIHDFLAPLVKRRSWALGGGAVESRFVSCHWRTRVGMRHGMFHDSGKNDPWGWSVQSLESRNSKTRSNTVCDHASPDIPQMG